MLLEPVRPPVRNGIDLRCCDCAEMLATLDEPADLVIADPPWSYNGGHAGDAATSPDDHYGCLTIEQIRRHLAPVPWVASRMALWITWPILPEWSTPGGWRQVTGGAWVKSAPGDTGHYGPGFHWSGCSEPVIVYTLGTNTPNDRACPVRNAWIEPPGLHSRKPARWMAQWIRRWVEPGGLVVDPYAGLGSVAEAVILAGEGRRYVGSEIDPERHRAALGLLAQVRA